ncbi:MAG: glycosyltransferase family 39 protein [Deltaproteobacteria bacterium]|nr:glycosyltransferase family 39 protein [Candidatus Zymogenaceae bacterium]
MKRPLTIERDLFSEKTTRILFWSLAAAAVLLRGIMLSTMAIISPDSPGYVRLAQSIAENGITAYFGGGFNPNLTIYPIFIHLVHLVVGDYVISGQITSLIFGCLSFIPVLYLARAAFDKETALMTLFLLSVHPLLMRYSAEVLKDTGLFFFILSGLALAHRGMEKDSPIISLFAGVVAWGAILMRFFGVIAVPVAAIGALSMGIAAGISKRRIVLHLGLFLIPIPLVGAVLFWHFVGIESCFINTDITTFFHDLIPTVPDAYADMLLSNPDYTGRMRSYLDLVTGHPYVFFLVELLSVLGSSFVDIFLFLFLLGLFVKPPADTGFASRIFLTVSAAAFFVFFYYVVSSFFFISKRHVMPVVLVLLPWSGVGLRYLLSFINNRADSLREKYPRTGLLTRRTSCVILSLWLCGAVIYSLSPYRQDDRYQRDAGEYIAREFGADTSILMYIADSRTAFYAESNPAYYSTLESLETSIGEGNKYDFVIWDTKAGPKPESLDGVMAEHGFVLLTTFTGTDDETIYIYRYETISLSPSQ